MQKRNKLIITFVFLVFLVAGLYFFTDWFSKTTGYAVGEDPDINLANCLTSKGIKMYGGKSCPICKFQESLFGEAFKFIPYVDCSKKLMECFDLESVPAWEINGKIYYGIKELSTLRILSGCKEN